MKLEEVIKNRVIGQEKAISAVARAVRRNRAGLREPRRPVGVFLFTGGDIFSTPPPHLNYAPFTKSRLYTQIPPNHRPVELCFKMN